MSVLDRLNAATATTSSIKICLDGEKQAEWDQILNNLEDTSLQATSLAAEETTAKIDRMEALRAEVAASEVTFDMRQMDWTARLNLQAAHPPRAGDFIDRSRGYNVVTYSREVIPRSCTAVTDGEGDTTTNVPPDTWLHLLGRGEEGDPDYIPPALNFGQVEELFSAAVKVNDTGTSIPPSARSFSPNPGSGTSSKSSKPGKAPARSGGKGGNRRTSPKSPTGTSLADPSGT